MFSRRPDRPKEEPRFPTSAPVPGQAPTGRSGDLIAVPAGGPTSPWGVAPAPTTSDPVSVAAANGDATVVAVGDHLEGTLRSAQGVLVLGSFSGSIASESWVRMGEGSTVIADVTAQEIVVAGRYEGRLVATSRLEIAATGHLRGDIHAPRLQLHEGGIIDGALVMSPSEVERARTARGAETGPGPATGAEAASSSRSKPTSVRDGGAGTSPRTDPVADPTAIPVGADAEPAVPAMPAVPEVQAAR